MEKEQKKHFLSIIIPTYKQEQTIVKNIRHIKSALDKIRYNYEIIVVIDGILDNASRTIRNAKIPHVKTITYAKNQGKAHAIRVGMKRAVGDYVMYMDSGQEINPNGISMLLEHMEWYQADIIVGSKRHPASLVHYPLIRKILSYGYYYLVKVLFNIKVRDTQAGIKIYRNRVLKRILPRLVEKKFAGDLEMLVVARTLGYKKIYEAPIKLNYNLGGVTSAATWKSIWGILVDTIAIYYRTFVLRYYEKNKK